MPKKFNEIKPHDPVADKWQAEPNADMIVAAVEWEDMVDAADMLEELESFDGFTICLDEVPIEEVRWLWHAWLVRDALNMLDGDPGILKTYVAICLCAAITRGQNIMPDDEGEPVKGRILYFSTEDQASSVLHPRLLAAGADVSQCFVLNPDHQVEDTKSKDGKMKDYFFTLDDMAELELEVDRIKPVLIVLDPMYGMLPSETNPNSEADMRPLLRSLARLCEKKHVTILAIRHCKKGDSSSALMSGGGSIGVSAAVRCNLFMANDPKDPDTSVLAVSKNNYIRKPTSLTCTIKDGIFQWTGTSELTADDLNIARNERGKPTKKTACIEWLQSRLTSQHEYKRTILKEGYILKYSKRTIERAAQQLVKDEVMVTTGPNQKKIWSLIAVAVDPLLTEKNIAKLTAEGIAEEEVEVEAKKEKKDDANTGSVDTDGPAAGTDTATQEEETASV